MFAQEGLRWSSFSGARNKSSEEQARGVGKVQRRANLPSKLEPAIRLSFRRSLDQDSHSYIPPTLSLLQERLLVR